MKSSPAEHAALRSAMKRASTAVRPVAFAKPRFHQREALTAIAKVLSEHDRAKAIMACGTGKTLLEMWVAQSVSPTLVLFLVPTLVLLKQTYDIWRAQNDLVGWGGPLKTLCVCSDPRIGQDEVTYTQSEFPTCTDPEVAKEFLAGFVRGRRTTGVVFCTYQSAGIIGQALKLLQDDRLVFDIGIFDEAHKTVGDTFGPDPQSFGYALNDSNIRMRKRVFFTATPRVIKRGRRSGDAADGYYVASMFNEAVFGPTAYTLSFSEAARATPDRPAIIVPYKLVISVVDAEEPGADGVDVGLHARLANQYVVRRAMENYGLKKAITFHRTIDDAGSFTEPSEADSVLPHAKVFHVSGRQSATQRSAIMDKFAAADTAIVTNATCLTEGVDIPAVDLAAFISPKRSGVDIVQAVGRTMRLSPGKEYGHVLVPLHLDTRAGETMDEAIVRTDFSDVIDVMRGLFENDDALNDLFTTYQVEEATRAGTGGPESIPTTAEGRPLFAVRTSETGGTPAAANAYVEFDISGVGPIPTASVRKLMSALKTRLVHDIGEPFYQRLSQWLSYVKHNGSTDGMRDADPSLWRWGKRQLIEGRKPGYPFRAVLEQCGFNFDTEVESAFDRNAAAYKAFVAETGTQPGVEHPVHGVFVEVQRRLMKGGNYPAERQALLESFGFDFDPQETQWNSMFKRLVDHRRRTGDCHIPQTQGEDGKWQSTQRMKERDGTLTEYRRLRLLSIGFVFNPRQEAWMMRLRELATFKAANGHCRVAAQDGPVGLWASRQRQLAKSPDYPPEKRLALEALAFEFVVPAGRIR